MKEHTLSTKIGRRVKGLCHIIDTLNEWAGNITRWLFIPLTFLVAFEVIARYVFNRPTLWAWDVNVQLLGILILFGGGYALLHGAHIGVDILVVTISPKKRATIEVFTSLVALLGISVLLWYAASRAVYSVGIQERYSSIFGPPLYPLRVLAVVGVILLWLQWIAKLIRDISIVTSHGEGEGCH